MMAWLQCWWRYRSPDAAQVPKPVPVTGSVAIMHIATGVDEAERRNACRYAMSRARRTTMIAPIAAVTTCEMKALPIPRLMPSALNK